MEPSSILLAAVKGVVAHPGQELHGLSLISDCCEQSTFMNHWRVFLAVLTAQRTAKPITQALAVREIRAIKWVHGALVSYHDSGNLLEVEE